MVRVTGSHLKRHRKYCYHSSCLVSPNICFWYTWGFYLFSRCITLRRPPSWSSTPLSFNQRISTLSRFRIGSRVLSKHLAFNFWMPRSFLSLGKECLPILVHSLSAPSQWLYSLLVWLSNQEMDFINFSLQSRGCTWGDPTIHSNIPPKGRHMMYGKSQRGGKKTEERWNQALTSSLARPAPWKGASIGKAAAALHFTVSLECTSMQPSLHLVRGLAFDDSAASRLPGEIGPTVWKTLSAPDHTCFYSLPVVRGLFWNGTPQEIRPKLWGVYAASCAPFSKAIIPK